MAEKLKLGLLTYALICIFAVFENTKNNVF